MMDSTLSNTVSRMVPRRAAASPAPPPPPPGSDGIGAEIARLVADRETARLALAVLEGERNAVLLTDDDAAAERHDAEMGKQRRAIERCDLRRPGLEQALADALAREEAERKAAQVAEAEAEISAVMADIAAEYMGPAGRIAAFLARYEAANAKARAAGVADIDRRIRFKAGSREPDREVDHRYFVDERGQLTTDPYPPMQYAREDDDGVRYNELGYAIPMRGRRWGKRTVKGAVIPQQGAPDLATVVNLPGAHLGEPDFHTASGLERPSGDDHRRIPW